MGFFVPNDEWRLMKSAKEKIDSINIVVSAYRSVRLPGVYVTMPISSGMRQYEVMDEYGVDSIDGLIAVDKDILYEKIIKPNIEDGIGYADRLQSLIERPVIAPSVFEAKKQRWSQDEYMFLWMRVMEEKMITHYLKFGWQYSNGGADEYVRSFEMQCGFINPERGMEFVPPDVDKEKLYTQMRSCEVRTTGDIMNGHNIAIGMKPHKAAYEIHLAIIDLLKRNKNYRPFSLMASLDTIASIFDYFKNYSQKEKSKYIGKSYEWADGMAQGWFGEVVKHNRAFADEYIEHVKKMPDDWKKDRYSLKAAV